ncbi:unnamed protein product, partial [Rotaria magnacalcarata]
QEEQRIAQRRDSLGPNGLKKLKDELD